MIQEQSCWSSLTCWCWDSCSASGMFRGTVCHLWHMDYTCRQYDSMESESGEEKTPVHPEIEC